LYYGLLHRVPIFIRGGHTLIISRLSCRILQI
jgi:hypothetical protein